MRRGLPFVLVLAMVCAGVSRAVPTAAPPAPEIRLGDSYLALSGPWRFAPGDSPVSNGVLAWADPGFDDSAWFSMDLHATTVDADPAYGSQGYLTGWTGRGFPGLSGFAWYRLRLHIAPGQTLALKMPDHVDDAFQVFANGSLIGTFGDFSRSDVGCFRSRPLVYALPAPDASGNLVLAIRFYMQPFVLSAGSTPDSGGMHQTPILALPAQAESLRVQEVRARLLSQTGAFMVSFIALIAMAGALWIWLLDRKHSTYLWLALALFAQIADTVNYLVSIFSYAMVQDTSAFLAVNLLQLGLICWILFWRGWFGLQSDRSSNRMAFALGVAIFGVSIYVYLLGGHADPRSLRLGLQIGALCKFGLGALLLLSLFQGARKDRNGALFALLPIALVAVASFSVELLTWFRIKTDFFPFGVQLGLRNIASLLLVLVIGALVGRRFVATQVSQRLARLAIDQDLEQASELQQRVLIPEPIPDTSVFAVETAYFPARSVGGDFFQVIPYADGSLLMVIGDVSGKGVAAAMLVAVLVGATRTRADETCDPAAILRTLGDRLQGRAGDHFATCLAAHLRPDGVMLIANAGHIPPYLNGVALDLPGSIPLGIVPDAGYEVHRVALAPRDRLTFLTDGVPEARDAAGKLLGFDFTAQISHLPPKVIAEAAIAHGQDDDITVVGVKMQTARSGV